MSSHACANFNEEASDNQAREILLMCGRFVVRSRILGVLLDIVLADAVVLIVSIATIGATAG